MNTQALVEEHKSIMALASLLGGVASAIKSRSDSQEARALIQSIDALLRDHLAQEDEDLYPALMAAEDEETRRLGADASEAMGGIVGAWNNYRDHWTLEVILGQARRFAAATEALVGALALRIEMENEVLYPAMERLNAAAGRAAA